MNGGTSGALFGGAAAASGAYISSKANSINPWTGKSSEQYLYHYTDEKSASNILENGLSINERRPYVYTTDAGDLSPMQAQIELGLPSNRALPSSVLKVDVTNLSPFQVRRVTGNLPGMSAGGGREFIFNQSIPSNRISLFKR